MTALAGGVLALSLLLAPALAIAQGSVQPVADAATAAGLAAPAEAGGLTLRARGAGEYRYFGFLVYQARLWAGPEFQAGRYAEGPLLLELRYARSLRGEAIAERSLLEMRRQGPFDAPQAERWLATMRQAFPDVAAGDRLSGLYQPGQPTRFFHNGRLTATLDDPEFARRFFGIWLAPQSSAPELRRALLDGGMP